MKANGIATKCMGKAPSHGPTGVNILGNMIMIKRKATVNLYGPTEEATEGNGLTGNNMEKELISRIGGMKDMENGRTGKGPDGSEIE